MTSLEPLRSPSATSTRQAARPAVLAFAPSGWDGLWMNWQQLLSRLAARGWPVTYSTGALSTWDRGSAEWDSAPWINSYQMRDGVCVETPGKALLRWPRFAAADRLAVRLHAATLARRIGRGASETIAHIFHPVFQPYAKALDCRWTVYHAYDVFSQQPGWTDAMARMEEELVASADLVIASGAAILDALQGTAPARSAVLPERRGFHCLRVGPASALPGRSRRRSATAYWLYRKHQPKDRFRDHRNPRPGKAALALGDGRTGQGLRAQPPRQTTRRSHPHIMRAGSCRTSTSWARSHVRSCRPMPAT